MCTVYGADGLNHPAGCHSWLQALSGFLATAGNSVTVTLAHRQDGRWVTVKAKSVTVKRFGHGDGDLRTDAQYRAEFQRPGPGRYRVTTTFCGDYYTLRSSSQKGLPL